MRRWLALGILATFVTVVEVASAAIQKDQMISGGGQATATGIQATWAALGEPLGGRMSGGGVILTGGGSTPFSGNLPPYISALSPTNNSRFYPGTIVTLSATATDANNDPLQYRFLVDGLVLRDWSSVTTATWDTTAVSFGWHLLEADVKDATTTSIRQSRVFIFRKPPL